MKASSQTLSELLNFIPLSSESQCSYYSDKRSRTKSFRFDGDISPDFFEFLLQNGYRRCGNIYYQHNCRECRLCINCRVAVDHFRPSRSQKRVLRRNRDVTYTIAQPRLTAQKENIYLRYQYEQHYRKGAIPPGKSEQFDAGEHLRTMHFQMYTNPLSTRETEFRVDGQLIGFGILDIAQLTVSAVYFVFDPDQSKRSLGTFAILTGVGWAQRSGFKYYHLGYFIPDHPKMDYKKKFQAAEMLQRGDSQWRDADRKLAEISSSRA